MNRVLIWLDGTAYFLGLSIDVEKPVGKLSRIEYVAELETRRGQPLFRARAESLDRVMRRVVIEYVDKVQKQ